MTTQQLNEFAGLRRQLEIGVRIAPTLSQAAIAAKSVASLIDAFPGVPVRLVDISRDGSRVHITIAVCLGTIDAVKAGSPAARLALSLLQRIVDGFTSFDPAFVQLPAGRDGRHAPSVFAELVEAVG